MSRGEFTVALVGRPNVGKSTLFNRVARKRRAITFDQPGITRDLVAEPVEYDGRHFLLVDTGGYMTGGGGEGPLPRIAVVGRPNVGKSTLVNTLAGFERVIASEVPGTTRDAIDVMVERDGRKYLLIDTAGIRAKRKTEGAVEIFSVMKSLDSIKRCDLAVLLIDGPGGLTHQDRQVLRYILNEERAVVVAANKADGWNTEEERRKAMRAIQEGLEYASFAPVIPTVATSGKGFPLLFRKIEEASANFRLRVPTGPLNRMAQSFLYAVPIPSQQGRNRAFYITQVGVAPPSFAVFVKDRRGIPESFTRYLQNKIRDRFGFEGAPVRIVYRER